METNNKVAFVRINSQEYVVEVVFLMAFHHSEKKTKHSLNR